MTVDMTVKICFVMDCTSSMEPWIEQAKTHIAAIMDDVSLDHPNARCRVGFVGYRDYGDRDRLFTVGFQNPADTMEQIRSVRAEGGDDIAEDVAHGLDAAVMMNWSGADVRIVVHIADAPGHGFMYHNVLLSDRYPHGDPAGLDLDIIMQRLSSLGIDFTFVKINDSTDTMLEAFHNSYGHGGTFRVLDLRPQNFERGAPHTHLPPLLTRAITNSIGQHTISQETQYY
jgi:hypothetical protein